MTGWLAGRRALVVGAGSGIGRAVVDAFLAEGARVAVLERDPGKCAALAAEIPGRAGRRRATPPPARPTRRAVAAAVAAFGGLDVLVNCVGVFDFYRGPRRPRRRPIDDAFDEMFSRQRREPPARGEGRAARAAGQPAAVIAHRVHVGVLPRPRRGAVRVVEVRRARARHRARARAGARTSGSTASRPAARWAPTCAVSPASASTAGASTTRPAGPRSSPPASRSPSRSPARTTPGATSSSPPTGRAGSPATSSTPTAAWGCDEPRPGARAGGRGLPGAGRPRPRRRRARPRQPADRAGHPAGPLPGPARARARASPTPSTSGTSTSTGSRQGEGELAEHAVPNELPLHTEVLRTRPEVQAVVHAHPPDVVAADLAGLAHPPDRRRLRHPGHAARRRQGARPPARCADPRPRGWPGRWSLPWRAAGRACCAATA